MTGIDEVVLKGLAFELIVDDDSASGKHSEYYEFRFSIAPKYLRSLIVSLANGVAKNDRVNVHVVFS